MDEKKQKVMPSRELKVKIGENSYTIKFPKNGQLIDIEVRKMSLTGGMHRDLALGLSAAATAAMLAGASCTFGVLIPELQKDLNVSSILELDQMQSKSIVKAYEQYHEWMNGWNAYLNDDEDQKKEEDHE